MIFHEQDAGGIVTTRGKLSKNGIARYLWVIGNGTWPPELRQYREKRMAKEKKSPATMETYLQQLDPELAAIVQSLRRTILDTDPEIAEQIKWNSPSFYFSGEMQPFDPKEYKRDIVVLNLHRGHPLLVFPTGARITDESGLLEGDFKDGRRMVTIRSLAEAEAKAAGLQSVIRVWLSMVER